jgi:hypothetical protein
LATIADTPKGISELNLFKKQMSGPHSASPPSGRQYNLNMLPGQNLRDLDAVRGSPFANIVGYDP